MIHAPSKQSFPKIFLLVKGLKCRVNYSDLAQKIDSSNYKTSQTVENISSVYFIYQLSKFFN